MGWFTTTFLVLICTSLREKHIPFILVPTKISQAKSQVHPVFWQLFTLTNPVVENRLVTTLTYNFQCDVCSYHTLQTAGGGVSAGGSHILKATSVDGRNPAPVAAGSLSHYLPGLIHPKWCSISSINSKSMKNICNQRLWKIGGNKVWKPLSNL